jgi:hypothetical protein
LVVKIANKVRAGSRALDIIAIKMGKPSAASHMPYHLSNIVECNADNHGGV